MDFPSNGNGQKSTCHFLLSKITVHFYPLLVPLALFPMTLTTEIRTKRVAINLHFIA